ncbi:MAG TPA: type VI secretion system-associated FHA domain protein TagH [Candidatus Acidoferrum sp.]|nr:type VI secretion system-associated FHA domain protein TagH [Candidatus Acidoferrum sp.]
MILTLTIAKHPDLPPGEAMSRTFDRCNAVIGRGSDSDWQLPDPERHLSKQHCRIEFRGDRYYLVDTSKNGVFVNDSIEPLRQGNMAELQDGDRLTLGDYELEVRIESERRRATGGSQQIPDDFDPFPEESAAQAPLASQSRRSEPEFRDEMLIHNTDPGVDPIAELAGPENRSLGGGQALIPDDFDLVTGLPKGESHEGAPQKDHAPAEQQYFQPPSRVRQEIPEDWEAEVAERPAPQPQKRSAARPPAEPLEEPAPPRTRTATTGAGSRDLFRVFLEGAGVEDLQLSDADLEKTMHGLGQIFREVIAGLRDILMGRTAFKSEFRIERTMIQQRENNPLKFSISADEALLAILRRPGPGYMPGVEAVHQAIEDVKVHQLAVVAGLQVALTAILREFDPENLKERLEQQRSVLANLMPGAKNAKAWEIYEAFYKEVAAGAEQGFDGPFGREFRRAYEEQLKKL